MDQNPHHAFDLHVQYAEAAATHHQIEERTDTPPIGWAISTLSLEIDEQIILENLAVAEKLAQNPIWNP